MVLHVLYNFRYIFIRTENWPCHMVFGGVMGTKTKISTLPSRVRFSCNLLSTCFSRDFMRYASSGYFAVYQETRSTPIMASLLPAAIRDLQITRITSLQVTISFTAPGSILDNGRGKVKMCMYTDSEFWELVFDDLANDALL